MPRYLASHHAVARLLERFPALVPVAGRGLAAAQWLARLAARARVAAQQSGMDLMLCLDLPLAGGPARIYLPVTPRAGDTWSIRTVLTEAQALANQRKASVKTGAFPLTGPGQTASAEPTVFRGFSRYLNLSVRPGPPPGRAGHPRIRPAAPQSL
jgi:hypothetical protein